MGYLVPPWPRRFRLTFAVFRAAPSSAPLLTRVHPRLSFAAPTERESIVPARLLPQSSTSPGVWSLLRDMSSRSPLTDRCPTPIYVPSSAFHPLSTVYSSSRLVDLFHSTTAYEIPLQGFSPTASRPDSSPCRSLLSLTPLASPLPKLQLQLPTPRLQGVDPTAGPWSRIGGLDQFRTRSPLEFSTPAGLPSIT